MKEFVDILTNKEARKKQMFERDPDILAFQTTTPAPTFSVKLGGKDYVIQLDPKTNMRKFSYGDVDINLVSGIEPITVRTNNGTVIIGYKWTNYPDDIAAKLWSSPTTTGGQVGPFESWIQAMFPPSAKSYAGLTPAQIVASQQQEWARSTLGRITLDVEQQRQLLSSHLQHAFATTLPSAPWIDPNLSLATIGSMTPAQIKAHNQKMAAQMNSTALSQLSQVFAAGLAQSVASVTAASSAIATYRRMVDEKLRALGSNPTDEQLAQATISLNESIKNNIAMLGGPVSYPAFRIVFERGASGPQAKVDIAYNPEAPVGVKEKLGSTGVVRETTGESAFLPGNMAERELERIQRLTEMYNILVKTVSAQKELEIAAAVPGLNYDQTSAMMAQAEYDGIRDYIKSLKSQKSYQTASPMIRELVEAIEKLLQEVVPLPYVRTQEAPGTSTMV